MNKLFIFDTKIFSMKRIFVLLLLSFFVSKGFSQWTPPDNTYGKQAKRSKIDSTLYIPTGCGVPTDSTFLHDKTMQKQAAKYYDSCGNNEYVWDPSLKTWKQVGGDSNFYATRNWTTSNFNPLLGYTPLNPANNLADVTNITTARSNIQAIGIGDTASMLSPYRRTSTKITNSDLAGSIDLTTKVTGILPLTNGGTGSSTQNFVDLTTNQTIAGTKTFNGEPLFNLGAQISYGNVIQYLNSGATQAINLHSNVYASADYWFHGTKYGSGIDTIFTYGDTALLNLSTRFSNVYSAIPSITGKVNYTDTASMLSHYALLSSLNITNWNTAYTYRISTYSAPLYISGNNISINQSGTSTNGYLSSTDWNTFNNKQNALGYTAENTANKGAANGYASLDGTSKVPTSQLPSLALNNVWTVSSQSAMLALSSAVIGDVAVRSDSSITYVLKATDYTKPYNWVQLLFPTAPVSSVNGLTGAVNLTTNNISESANLYYTDARARAAHSFSAGSGGYNSTTGVITIPTNTNQLTNGANFITNSSLSVTTNSASGGGSLSYSSGVFTFTPPNLSSYLTSVDSTIYSTKLNVLNQLNKYTGSSNIVTVGTITTGVWNATAIADTYIASASTWNGKQAAYTNLTSIGSLTNGTGWLYNNGTGTFSYTSPTKTTVGLGNVENTALSTWAGTSNITTVGTLSSGSIPYSLLSGTVPTWNQNTTGTASNITASSNSTITSLTNASGLALSGALSGTSASFSGTLGVTGAATFSSSVTATSFSGAGTGLTGTASGLVAGNSLALGGYTWSGSHYTTPGLQPH